MSTLEDMRRSKGMRQDDLASCAGIAVSTLSMYENGLRTIPEDVARKIANALGCDLGAIFMPAKFKVREFDREGVQCDAAN